jgi:hypothetical protein
MEEEQGLAQSSVMQLLEQVVAMLMEGMSPQQLLQQGVPKEILEIAMQIVQQEQQAAQSQSAQVPPQQAAPQQAAAGVPVNPANMAAMGQ